MIIIIIKVKHLKCRLLQFLFGAFRVNRMSSTRYFMLRGEIKFNMKNFRSVLSENISIRMYIK